MKAPPALDDDDTRGARRFGGSRAAQLVPQPRLSGPMPWVIAVMVALTVIAAAGGLALANMAAGARAELAGGVTVQIMEASRPDRDAQTRAAIAALDDHPTVAATRRVPEEELTALLEPWLGVGIDDGAIPIPALIDVRLNDAASERTLNRLRGLLIDIAPAARIDAQSSWLAPVFSTIESLKWLAAVLIVLLGATSAAAVWLAARSALGANSDTVEIVHLLGGTDGQIARIFERAMGFDAVIGGVAGMALGLVAVLILGQQFSDLGAGMAAGGGADGALALFDWVLIACIPLVGVAIAVLTARITVLAALRRML
ncbi:MAG: cell division protein [Pontixanthobacter sp.]